MNILITLPKNLIQDIIAGEKQFEMRLCLPKKLRLGIDGFFAVEKGTDDVRCWCRVDEVRKGFMDSLTAKHYSSRLCVSEDYILRYANRKMVYLWKIGKVKKFDCFNRNWLFVDRNPQQFAYCPLSYGESY